MPLKIDFKAGEKMVINGAVLENIGPNAKIIVHNQAAILREKEVLKVDDCATPASRVYFALQCAYMFPDKEAEYLQSFNKYLGDYVQACPSAADIADSVRALVEQQALYKGLRESRKLIAHEVSTLDSFHEGMARISELADEDDVDIEQIDQLEDETDPLAKTQP